MIKNNEKTPLVVIRCTIYNHEPYLRDCLEGFVMQQTNFPFVAIVHDDASTDASAAIIREYEEKYPEIIKPIYETENQYSKNDGSLTRIMNEAIEATAAKYVAMCEGDDYWTDPLKLQKQVDFLEANPEYSICFHNVNILIQETGEVKEDFMVRDVSETSTIMDLAKGNYIYTPTVIYRIYPDIFEQYKTLTPCFPGDYIMWLLLSMKGNIYKMVDIMAIYRHGNGVWISNNDYILKKILLITSLSKLLIKVENSYFRNIIKEQIDDITNSISLEFNHVLNDYDTIKNSKAYKLGKIFLLPFYKIRNFIKNE